MPSSCLARLALFACLLIPDFGFGQFTYIGGNVGHQALRYTKSMYGRTSQKVLEFDLSVMVRPIRRVAIGGGVLLPLVVKDEFDFGWCKTSDGSTFRNFRSIGDNDARYVPQVFRYNLKRSTGLQLRGRFFLGMMANTYLYVGIVKYTLSEEFRLDRMYRPTEYYDFSGGIRYGAVPARPISVKKDHSLVVPEIALGMMPHMGRHTYLDLRIALTFISYGQPSFSQDVEYYWGVWDQHEPVRLASPLQGSHKSFHFQAGVGCYF